MAKDPLGEIVECRIHPAIGIARLGDSPSDWFVGPETPGPVATPAGGFKDPGGHVKRQAARFRVFGYDRDGRPVKELTADDAQIIWSVHLANKKAVWYEWIFAPDIPEAKGELDHPRSRGPITMRRRNRIAAPADRARMRIDGGPRAIAGRSANANGEDPRARFSGRFLDIDVALGELRTDEAGRLLVFGGFGRSGGAGEGAALRSRANNNDWYDDTSDGPVQASIVIDGRRFDAAPAWVVCAPPSFAPGVRAVVTAYDIVLDAAVQIDPAQRSARPSFREHLFPLFETFWQNQWVNAGFLRDFGWFAENNPFAPQNVDRLRDAGAANRPFRQSLFTQFRDPAYDTMAFEQLPNYYGDGTDFPAKDPRQWLALTQLQYDWLRQWAEGDFDDDWPSDGEPYASSLDDLPVERRPGALDRAALDACVGGSFNPGHELSWAIRQPLLYESPFRIRHRRLEGGPQRSRAGQLSDAEPDFGEAIDSRIALAPDGPLGASGPGDLTKWMPLPWQADAVTCRSGFEPELDLYLPTFWPAGLPNDVLSQEIYERLIDPAISAEERRQLFFNRAGFFRSLPSDFFASMSAFAAEWARFGFVTEQPRPAELDDLPDTLFVETGNDHVG